MIPGMLSVVLCNYNHSQVITDQIKAILAQSFGNFELIILDDASTDNSIAVIEAAAAGDPRVILVKNEKNIGVVANYEKGRQMSRGEFFFQTAADDRVLPGFFETCVNALQQVPQASLCCTDPATFHHQTGVVDPRPLYLSKAPTFIPPETLAEVICGRFIGSWAAIMRQQAYHDAIPSPEMWARLKWRHDWFIVHAMAFRGGVCYVPGVMAAIRVDPNSYAQKGIRDWDQDKDVLLAIMELLRSEKYSDVLPHFVRGALMSIFPGIDRLVMSHPELWDARTIMLLQRPLLDWVLRMDKTLVELKRVNGPGTA